MRRNKRAGLIPRSVAYKYAIDVFSASHISGWCFHRFKKNEPLTLVFSAGENILGECTANALREDIREQALHPDGKCGFSFIFPKRQMAGQAGSDNTIVVSIKESGAELCKLDMGLADRVTGRPTHPFSRIRQRLSGAGKRRDKVLFMHIPKTAGTTFNTFAKSVYPPDRALTHVESYDAHECVQIAEDYQFVSGHLNMGQIRRYFPPDCFRLYTLVREPYAHLHSHFNWLRGIGADRDSPFYQSHHHAFRLIADQLSEKSALDYDDLQIIVDQISGLSRHLFENSQTRYFLDEPCDRVGTEELAAAKQNTALFDLIGTTEQYAEFRSAFCRAQHFKFTPSHHAFNSSRMNSLFDHEDPKVREILYPLADKDLTLYQFVKKYK